MYKHRNGTVLLVALILMIFGAVQAQDTSTSLTKREETRLQRQQDVIGLYQKFPFARIPWLVLFNDSDLDPEVVIQFFEEKSQGVDLKGEHRKIHKKFHLYQELRLIRRYQRGSARYNRISNRSESTIGLRSAPFSTGNWQYIGETPSPFVTNNGRLERVNFHPTDEDIIWASAPEGGLWRTTDGGANWTIIDDFWDHLGTGDLVYDQSNNNILYLATDDHDSWFTDNRGVLKSIDGGSTWNVVGLDATLATNVYKLGMQPDGTSLYACTSSGLFTSSNGGVTWVKNATLPANLQVNDLEYHPTNSSIMYVAERGIAVANANPNIGNTNYLYISTDGGLTWTTPTMPFDSDGERTQVVVSPLDDDIVYVGVYPRAVSGNNRTGVTVIQYDQSTGSVTKQSDPSVDQGIQIPGAWDFRIEVDPADENHLIYGCVNGVESFDGGVTWTPFNNLHADYHDIKWQSTSGGTRLWIADDGGLAYTLNGGTNWTHFPNIPVLQPAHNFSSDDGSIFMMGIQDAGNQFDFKGNYFFVPGGGDGLRGKVDPVDENIIYYTVQQGLELGKVTFNPTANNFTSNSILNQSIGGSIVPWSIPVIIDRDDHNTLYTGFADVWKSTDQGANWTNLSNGGFGNSGSSSIDLLLQAPSNPDIFYGSSITGGFVKSTDRGLTWTSIPGVPLLLNSRFNSVVIHPQDADILWAIKDNLSGVLKSTNGGQNWTDVSGNLPSDIKLYNIAYQDGTANGIYVGGNFGELWYKDDNLTDWQQHDQNLPNCWVRNIEVLPLINKVRVSTWGRGIWEGDTYVNSVNPCDEPAPPQITLTNCFADAMLTLSSAAPSGYEIKWYLDGNEIAGESGTTLMVTTEGIYTARYLALTGTCHSYLSEKAQVQFITNVTYYQDSDGDGFGNPNVTTMEPCTPGYVDNPSDCDDTSAAINPYAEEICSGGIDEDCDGNTDAEVNKGLDFDGVNDFLSIANPPSYSNPMTVEFWAKTTAAEFDNVIIWTGPNGNRVRLIIDSGRMRYEEIDDSNNELTGFQGAIANDGNWHHFAFVRSAGTVTTYLDGALNWTDNSLSATPAGGCHDYWNI